MGELGGSSARTNGTVCFQGSKLAHGSVESFSTVVSRELERLVAESDRVEDLLRSVERNVQAVAEVNRAVARLLDEAPSVEAKEFSIIRYLS